MIQFVANFIIIVSCSRQIHVVSEFEHVKAIVLGLQISCNDRERAWP